MRRRRLSNSMRKHIRNEKSRIRALVSDTKEAEEKIKELVARVAGVYAGLTFPKK